MPRPFRFGVNCASFTSRAEWRDLARRLEAGGWSTLLLPDHLGSVSTLAPLVAAADATTTLRVGSLVLNNDFAHPLRLAQELATVDLLTEGRLEIGLGSGWAQPEYELLGVAYDRPARRADRLAQAIETMEAAWAGQPTLDTPTGPAPAVPAPFQRPRPPLLLGGHGDRLLSLAARTADIVGFTGLTWTGSSLAPTGASVEAIAERVAFVRAAAGERFDQLELSILVQLVSVGAPVAEQADRLAAELGVPADAVRTSPIALVGTAGEVADKVVGLREQIGISYFTVFDSAATALAPVVEALAGT